MNKVRQLLDFWDLIAGIIIVAFMFGSLNSIQSAQASKIEKLESVVNEMNEINVRLARIEERLEYSINKRK